MKRRVGDSEKWSWLKLIENLKIKNKVVRCLNQCEWGNNLN